MKELINVQIETKEGVNVVSSRVIAEELGKEHAKVRRTLSELIEITPHLATSIIEAEYKDNMNRTQKEYLLTKDGFTLYMFNIQGYNDFKMTYINKFNEMERQLKEQQAQINQKDRLLLDLFSDEPSVVAVAHKKLVELEKAPLLEQLEEQKPKVEFAETVQNSDGCVDVAELSKIISSQLEISIGRNKLFKLLRDKRYLRDNNTPYQQYIDQGLFKVIQVAKGCKLYPKTLVTGKGEIYFIKKIKQWLNVEEREVELDLNIFTSNINISL